MPRLSYDIPAITSGSYYTLEPDGILKNQILHSAIINNNSDEDIRLYMNGSKNVFYDVPAGMIGKIEDETFQNILLYNRSATDTAANEVNIVLSSDRFVYGGHD